jgi:hypothetical protein
VHTAPAHRMASKSTGDFTKLGNIDTTMICLPLHGCNDGWTGNE